MKKQTVTSVRNNNNRGNPDEKGLPMAIPAARHTASGSNGACRWGKSRFTGQSYEKSRAKQKNLFFFLPRRSKFANLLAKLRKVESKTKEFILFFAETE